MATVERTDECHVQGKSYDPGAGEEQIDGIVKEPAGEGDEPDQGKDDGQASDNFGVDGAAVRPIVEKGKRVDVVADKTCNDG